jgi:hypothetical protein
VTTGNLPGPGPALPVARAGGKIAVAGSESPPESRLATAPSGSPLRDQGQERGRAAQFKFGPPNGPLGMSLLSCPTSREGWMPSLSFTIELWGALFSCVRFRGLRKDPARALIVY